MKVANDMTKDSAQGTTIHWHGMYMEGTPYMDGAFMVTQCPIPIGESFTYNFTAYPHGTHWYVRIHYKIASMLCTMGALTSTCGLGGLVQNNEILKVNFKIFKFLKTIPSYC